MTTVGSAKPFGTRFESYLRSAFHPIPQEAAVVQLIHSLFVWFFSLPRNIVICGFLHILPT